MEFCKDAELKMALVKLAKSNILGGFSTTDFTGGLVAWEWIIPQIGEVVSNDHPPFDKAWS